MIGAAIATAWTSLGAMSIGAFAVGTMIQGAIIGAAIGGLTAAVTGGSIGKGMLFGGIGGAVVGGISGTLSNLSALSAANTAAGSTFENFAGMAGTQSTMGAGGMSATSGASLGSGSISMSLDSTGGQILGKVVESGIGAYVSNENQKDLLKANKEESALAYERDIAKMKLASSLAGGSGGSGGSSGVDNTGAKLAYDARMAELAQRSKEFDTQTKQTRLEWNTEMDRRKQRQGLFKSSSSAKPDTGSDNIGDEGIQSKRQDQSIEAPEAALNGPTMTTEGSN